MNDTWAWIIIGFAGQALFSARFVLQWVASERARRSIVPKAFWYFSLAGSAVLLLDADNYAIRMSLILMDMRLNSRRVAAEVSALICARASTRRSNVSPLSTSRSVESPVSAETRPGGEQHV